MAEGDGAAVGIDAVWIESGLVDDGEGLRREGFVEFEYSDVFEFEPGKFERFGNGEDRPESHFFGLVASRGEGDVAGKGLDTEMLGAVGGHHNRGSGSIRHLRGVAGG